MILSWRSGCFRVIGLIVLLVFANPVLGQSGGFSLKGLIDQAVDKLPLHLKPTAESSVDPAKDRFCDSLEESYEVTDNVMAVMSGSVLQRLDEWRKRGFTQTRNDQEFEQTIKEVSKKYVWIPLSAESEIGAYLHMQEEAKDKNILLRKGKRAENLYVKAEAALAAAIKQYPKLPYQPRVFIVKREHINAEALPGGYIYVSEPAASKLPADALALVMGHEVAHIAKRHTSKELQQRLIDTGAALELVKGIMGRRADGAYKLSATEQTVQRFQGVFAKYDQGQELQADACSVRGMVADNKDPTKARAEYLRIRGDTKDAKNAAQRQNQRGFGLGYTEHPEDETRDQFFRQAYQHHKTKQTR